MKNQVLVEERGELSIRLKLGEVAKRSGVSISTVSRVLNNKPGVDPETRERILATLAELQFNPTEPVVQRYRANNPLIGFLIPDAMKSVGLTTYVYLNQIRAIQQVADAGGFGLFVGTYRGVDGPTPGDRMLKDGALAGAVIARTRLADLDFTEFRERNIPFVVLNRFFEPGNGVHSVSVDDMEAGMAVTEHFLAMGHQRIALLRGPLDIPTSAVRTLGFRQAFQLRGLPISEELICETDLTEASARQATEKLLALPEPPTALVALNDAMAIGAMEVARGLGLSVPGDLAVLGFDDTEIARHVQPMLTSMKVPWTEMTRVATRLLQEIIHTPDMQEAKVRFRTTLVIRESCGARHVEF